VRVSGREIVKSAVRGLALVCVAPALASFAVRARLDSRDRALQSSSEWLALIPGLTGQYLRRAFYSCALAGCHHTATIEAGTVFCRAGARLEANVYIGAACRLGLVHVERDALIASGVHIPSGASTHRIDDLTRPIREQGRGERLVRIGAGAWIGERALVMADVGHDAVVGGGAVVTRPISPWYVAAGVPARAIRRRGESRAAAMVV
jgi:acetyltransferase-like isoleucine patch superfamily enzyme